MILDFGCFGAAFQDKGCGFLAVSGIGLSWLAFHHLATLIIRDSLTGFTVHNPFNDHDLPLKFSYYKKISGFGACSAV